MTVTEYIHDHLERSIYRDEPGTGFAGIDLPYRYTSPCIKGEGNFYFFFYWDTAFTLRALYATGNAAVARENIQNMLWLIRRQGYMPNHVGIHNRSQSPYLCRMVADYFAYLGGPEEDPSFFRACAEGLLQEYNWWITARLHPTGLCQHGTHETWEGMERFAENQRVQKISPSKAQTLTEKRGIGAHFLAEAEATCDFTPRFEHRCLDYVQPDLNGLLYDYERFFADHHELLKWDFAIDWSTRANLRRERLNRYCWSEVRGLFLDYDGVHNRHGPVAALTGVQLLIHGIPTEAQAARIVQNLPLFEREYGIAYTEECPECRAYQWAFPAVWPPMVQNTVLGLARYGYHSAARRIAQKYVEVTDRLFEAKGRIFEKTDAETGELAEAEYEPSPMMGWTAGVYLTCASYLQHSRTAPSL
ncbi:MAG: trehalase family glycosidase [Opitutales bacterium]